MHTVGLDSRYVRESIAQGGVSKGKEVQACAGEPFGNISAPPDSCKERWLVVKYGVGEDEKGEWRYSVALGDLLRLCAWGKQCW